MKELNRQIFKDAFGITQDEDFIHYRSADPQQVSHYDNGEEEGPDPKNLRFDMRSLGRSLWNGQVIEILADRFIDQAKEMPYVPQRPRKYVEQMILDKFNRCQMIWRSAQPKRSDTGDLETLEEVESRLNESKEITLTRQRHTTRRNQVRY